MHFVSYHDAIPAYCLGDLSFSITLDTVVSTVYIVQHRNRIFFHQISQLVERNIHAASTVNKFVNILSMTFNFVGKNGFLKNANKNESLSLFSSIYFIALQNVIINFAIFRKGM